MFDDIEEVKRKIDKAKGEILDKKAETDSILRQCQKKYQVSTIEEAKSLLAKKQKKLLKMAEEETERLKAFKKKYTSLLK